MNQKSFIWVTFQKEGIHCYPAAGNDPTLKTNDEYDVSFLGYPHRHIFKFKVSIEVFKDDRDIEFIQFKRWLESLYSKDVLNLNSKSCEMISDDLYKQIVVKYPNRDIAIEVSEDGENGSYTEYKKKVLNSEEEIKIDDVVIDLSTLFKTDAISKILEDAKGSTLNETISKFISNLKAPKK